MLTIEQLIKENRELRRLAILLVLARGGRTDIHQSLMQNYDPADYELQIVPYPEFREVVVRTVYQP